MKINFNHIYYFTVIAKEGSIKNASTKLNISASALSDQLRHLEERLGEQLFDRKSNRLVTNSVGEYLLDNIGLFFSETRIVIDSIVSRNFKHRKNINLGVTPSVSKNRVYELVKSFLSDGRYFINIHESSIFSLFNKLEKCDLDIIIHDSPISVSSARFFQHKLLDRKLVAISSANGHFDKRAFPSCLNDRSFINYTKDNELHDQIINYFSEHFIKVNEHCCIDDVNLIKIATENSKSFSIVPYITAEKEISANRLICIGGVNELKAKLFLCARKNNNLEDEINQLLSAVDD